MNIQMGLLIKVKLYATGTVIESRNLSIPVMEKSSMEEELIEISSILNLQ